MYISRFLKMDFFSEFYFKGRYNEHFVFEIDTTFLVNEQCVLWLQEILLKIMCPPVAMEPTFPFTKETTVWLVLLYLLPTKKVTIIKALIDIFKESTFPSLRLVFLRAET